MRFQCKYQVEDYIRAYKTYAQRGSRKWTTRLLWAIGIAGFLIAFFGSIGPKGKIGPALPLFFISAYLIYLASSIWAKAGRRAFSSRPELGQEFSVDIGDSGIVFDGPISGMRWTWPAFVKFIEAKDLFLAYLSPCAFVILPKRILGPGETDQVREVLLQKLPAK
jgi:hypothetical protein